MEVYSQETDELIRLADCMWSTANRLDDELDTPETYAILQSAYQVARNLKKLKNALRNQPAVSLRGGWNAGYEQSTKPFQVSQKTRRWKDGV